MGSPEFEQSFRLIYIVFDPDPVGSDKFQIYEAKIS